jgi:hypothetical protein
LATELTNSSDAIIKEVFEKMMKAEPTEAKRKKFNTPPDHILFIEK